MEILGIDVVALVCAMVVAIMAVGVYLWGYEVIRDDIFLLEGLFGRTVRCTRRGMAEIAINSVSLWKFFTGYIAAIPSMVMMLLGYAVTVGSLMLYLSRDISILSSIGCGVVALGGLGFASFSSLRY